MAMRVGSAGLDTSGYTSGPTRINVGGSTFVNNWADPEYAAMTGAGSSNMARVAANTFDSSGLAVRANTAGLQQVADYARQDREQGIRYYEDDRNRFYSGQAAANKAKTDAYNTNVGWITADRNRYAQVFQPLEERLAGLAIPKAEDYAQAEGKASADVNQAFAGRQAQMMRDAGRLGINPNSGRFASMMEAGGLEQTAAMTGALSNARAGVDKRADDALQLGLDVGQRYRQTQQVVAPELDYKVMGPREANGLEASLPSVATNIAQLQMEADKANLDAAWDYFKQLSSPGSGGRGGFTIDYDAKPVGFRGNK